MKYLLPISALLLVACNGSVTDQQPTGDQPVNPAGGGSGATDPNVAPAAAPFAVRNSEPELLPYDLRVRRVASALGVSVEHAMFQEMRDKNIKLGDYDHANGALPDGLWIARRISGWIAALKPVCASVEMKTLYPTMPESLPALVRAAWGRQPSAEDVAEFATAIAESGVDPATAYESSCMAVFTAAEFVYR